MVNLKWNQVVSLNWNWVVNITGICTQINTRKKVVFNENGSGHFVPKLGGQFDRLFHYAYT